jgi:hypothetical protein
MTTQISGTTGIDKVQDATVTPAKLTQPLTLSTMKSFSGTATEFTAIPSWAKRITLSFSGLSTNGTNIPLIQLGDSGGYESSGYSGAVTLHYNGSSPTVANFLSGFSIYSGAAANVIHGVVVLTLIDATTNLWACSYSGGFSNGTNAITGAGTKALSATLDRVRFITNSADVFDAGSVNIMYEG